MRQEDQRLQEGDDGEEAERYHGRGVRKTVCRVASFFFGRSGGEQFFWSGLDGFWWFVEVGEQQSGVCCFSGLDSDGGC